MATIRMARAAGAALIALTAIVPAAAQAQAPLQLVPGPGQAKKVAGVGATKAATSKSIARSPNNRARTVASKTSQRRNATQRQMAAAVRPSAAKSTRRARTEANAIASRRQVEPTASAERVESAARSATVAAQPAAPVAAAEPQVLAQGGNEHVTADNVMRGGSSVSLVGMLPWWRNDRMQDVVYGSEEAQSQVMAAADAWLAAHGGRADDSDETIDTGALLDRGVDVANADEVNEIDLAAAPVSRPPEQSFLQSLIAMIGDAIAAAAASARHLFG